MNERVSERARKREDVVAEAVMERVRVGDKEMVWMIQERDANVVVIARGQRRKTNMTVNGRSMFKMNLV